MSPFKSIDVSDLPPQRRGRKAVSEEFDQLFAGMTTRKAQIYPVGERLPKEVQSMLHAAARQRGLQVRTRQGDGVVYVWKRREER